MAVLKVTDRQGTTKAIETTPGPSVMEIIRDNGFDDLLALCGGSCACGTCHVHVDAQFVAALPPMSSEERDMLDGSVHRSAQSRLACQIRFDDRLDGLHVTIAPEH